MPTGYTAKLVERGQTFPEFVMTCARAFGACIDMRDDDLTTPIPDRFKPSDYHKKALIEAQLELRELRAMGKLAQKEFGESKKKAAIASVRKYLNEKRDENKRLEDMRSKVVEWVPPTADHAGVKKFMLEQIDTSMNDVDYSEDALRNYKSKPAIDFYLTAVESAKSSIEYHSKKSQEEVARADDRTEWVRQLRESLDETRT